MDLQPLSLDRLSGSLPVNKSRVLRTGVLALGLQSLNLAVQLCSPDELKCFELMDATTTEQSGSLRSNLFQ